MSVSTRRTGRCDHVAGDPAAFGPAGMGQDGARMRTRVTSRQITCDWTSLLGSDVYVLEVHPDGAWSEVAELRLHSSGLLALQVRRENSDGNSELAGGADVVSWDVGWGPTQFDVEGLVRDLGPDTELYALLQRVLDGTTWAPTPLSAQSSPQLEGDAQLADGEIRRHFSTPGPSGAQRYSTNAFPLRFARWLSRGAVPDGPGDRRADEHAALMEYLDVVQSIEDQQRADMEAWDDDG